MYTQSQSITDLKKISFKTDSEENLEQLRSILKNDLIKYDIEELHRYFLECKTEGILSDKFIGGLGFLIFTVAADQFPSEMQGTNFENLLEHERHNAVIANNIGLNIFKEKCVYDFINDEYELDKYSDGTTTGEKPIYIKWHKTGTTSYILQVRYSNIFDNKDIALKLIKFKYIDNFSIKSKTRNYKDAYPDFSKSPKIHFCGPAFIIMEFISGITLYEFIHKDLKNLPNRSEVISTIMIKLCNLLHSLACNGITHNDLSTKNIIINEKEYDNAKISFKLYLIDFGVNYLLNEKIGSSYALSKARAYIPKEVERDFNNASIMSDIYSLGVIFLEMYNKGEEFDDRKFEDYLDQLRQIQPVLASIIDDILDDNPDHRLFDLQVNYRRDIENNGLIMFNTPDTKNMFFYNFKQNHSVKEEITKTFAYIYIDLQRNIKFESDYFECAKKKRNNNWFRFFQAILSFLTGNLGVLFKQEFEDSLEIVNDEEIPVTGEINFRIIKKRLGVWSIYAIISHIAVCIGAFLIFLNFFNIKKISSVPPYINMNLNITDILTVIVLLSFSLIAVRYYLNIFKSLYTKTLGSWGFINNIWLRICTIYWPLPILVAIFYDRDLWAYIAAFGTLIVAINNFLNYKVAKKAAFIIKETFNHDLSQASSERLKDFSSWGGVMLFYSLCLLAIGISLEMGILKDKFAYLILILFCNYKMWKFNCNENAFNVSRTLQFLFTRYDRALKFKHQIAQKQYFNT